MGCCSSSPYTSRRYLDPGDLDEVEVDEDNVPIRTFGQTRNNSNVIPDDIIGLPSTQMEQHLASDPDVVLYEAEIDQGKAFSCLRPIILVCLCPPAWTSVAALGIGTVMQWCNCDQACLWVRKEYSTRRFFRVYSNRIEYNQITMRIPWGCLGCGSWNSDSMQTHVFDRGAFGFRRVHLSYTYLCCCWPIYGGSVARQRCPCNGSLWPRCRSDCGGCWCDEWLCDVCFCSYRYNYLANSDETAFACSIILQAYFEQRSITPQDVQRCITYWRSHLAEPDIYELATNEESVAKRKRKVCCEPKCVVPCPSLLGLYRSYTHLSRTIPPRYIENNLVTPQLEHAYQEYNQRCQSQIHRYETYEGPIRRSTLCRTCGCRRVFGRRGVCFCTEDCGYEMCCSHEKGHVAPGFGYWDVDDENDAARVLEKVLGSPPKNVVYRRGAGGFRLDEEKDGMEGGQELTKDILERDGASTDTVSKRTNAASSPARTVMSADAEEEDGKQSLFSDSLDAAKSK